jgi:hypothetical protein
MSKTRIVVAPLFCLFLAIACAESKPPSPEPRGEGSPLSCCTGACNCKQAQNCCAGLTCRDNGDCTADAVAPKVLASGQRTPTNADSASVGTIDTGGGGGGTRGVVCDRPDRPFLCTCNSGPLGLACCKNKQACCCQRVGNLGGCLDDNGNCSRD